MTDATEERIRREVDEYGWTVIGTVPNFSLAEFTHARARGEGLVRMDPDNGQQADVNDGPSFSTCRNPVWDACEHDSQTACATGMVR
jgi:hypothetical protein